MEDHNNGKIARATFEKTIWEKTGKRREEVMAGPKYGVDVSVVRLPGGLLMASASDPASLIPGLGLAESAWLTVHLTANDLATTGHRPMYAQFVLNLPVGTSDEVFSEYWGYIHQYCDRIGVAITGGHTGKVVGQESTFAGGVTMSLVTDHVLLSDRVTPGQVILMTKHCALSACAILAKSFPQKIVSLIGEPEWERVCETFWQTSVLDEAESAYSTGKVTAMHDITEGGVLGAVNEMCQAGGCGAVIREELLPVDETTRIMADLFDFDPACSLGSGSLLIACKEGDEKDIIRELTNKKIKVSVIGRTNADAGKVVVESKGSGNKVEFLSGGKDPYWKAYFGALEKGWK